MVPAILPTVVLWGLSALGTVRVWAHQKSVPLWVFILVLVPASFGVVVLVSTFFRRPDFHVTADPVNSFCSHATWENTPATQVRIAATFANGSKYDVVLMYAYLKGTKPLMHFDEPVHIPPRSVIQQDVLFFCTGSRRKITNPYEATFIFVDAGGRKFPQRMTIRGIPRPASVPSPAARDAVDNPRGSLE
jgi:hypothetical protein